MEDSLSKKMEANKDEVMEKMGFLTTMVERNNVIQDVKMDRTIRRAIREENMGRRFTRSVMRIVEELEAATARRPETSSVSAEENFRAEEARIMANMRQDAESIGAIKEMSRSIRNRRKTSPEAPRPLRRKENKKDEDEVIDVE